MALIPIQIPPGVYRNGTELQSAGRWFDANLVRWFEGTIRPMGGWRKRSETAITGIARGMLAWEDNGGDPWIATGTATNLQVFRVDGVMADITPEDLQAGDVSSSAKTGYGNATYGYQPYGVERINLTTITPATTWSMDTWGEYLVACSSADRRLLEWQIGFTTPTLAAPIENSPENCNAVMVTAERFVFALGADGNPRKVAWCDQEDNTVWTPSTLNQAGDVELVTSGSLMAGRRVRGMSLLWTDDDCHSAQYIGQPFIYSFERIGSGCGLIAAQAVSVVADTSAFWMGRNGFWMYDGVVKPLQSDVSDYVFRNMNSAQAAKVSAMHNPQYGEVWWFYPSASSNEIDSYVLYNYREGHWSIGQLTRSCGAGAGTFGKPLMVGLDGYVYEHEVGLLNTGNIYAESGPFQIAAGDNIMSVREVIPDELNQGDVDLTFSTRFYPNGDEQEFGPYSTANPTSVRFSGRQIKMKLQQSQNSSWRVGTMRLDAVAGGRR